MLTPLCFPAHQYERYLCLYYSVLTWPPDLMVLKFYYFALQSHVNNFAHCFKNLPFQTLLLARHPQRNSAPSPQHDIKPHRMVWLAVNGNTVITKPSSYILEDTNLLITEEKDSTVHWGRAITNEYK